MLCLFSVISWWSHSHIIVCKIAEEMLSKDQIRKLESLLTKTGYDHKDFYQFCTWQDDLKDINKLYIMGNWHFIDIPYLKEPYDINRLHFDLPTYNITTYLSSANRTLFEESTTSEWVWGFHLRSIIHFFGDIHTPHHNVGMYTNKYPNGDMGGNKYKLKCKYRDACKNIHMFWDSCAIKYPLPSITTKEEIKELEKNVSELIKIYPISEFALEYDPNNWSANSHEIAESYGYSTPENEEPSKSYFELTRNIATKQIVHAGYRLGYYLKQAIDAAPNEKSYISYLWIFNTFVFIADIILVVISLRKNSTNYSYLKI